MRARLDPSALGRPATDALRRLRPSSSSRASRAKSAAKTTALFGRDNGDKFARDAIDLSKRKIATSDDDVGDKVTVTFLGAGDSRVDVECGSNQYILDAGLAAGIEISNPSFANETSYNTAKETTLARFVDRQRRLRLRVYHVDAAAWPIDK